MILPVPYMRLIPDAQKTHVGSPNPDSMNCCSLTHHFK